MGADMMEEVLLGVPVVRGEVLADEGVELPRGGASPGEVKLTKGLENPGVDGEGLGKAVSKKEDAVGDFGADAGEAFEFGLGGEVIESGNGGEVDFVGCDH